jgi:hypothetical protein
VFEVEPRQILGSTSNTINSSCLIWNPYKINKSKATT